MPTLEVACEGRRRAEAREAMGGGRCTAGHAGREPGMYWLLPPLQPGEALRSLGSINLALHGTCPLAAADTARVH